MTWMFLLAGCVINGDKYLRPRDLAPNWLVDRTRILGVAAEPPEAAPGAPITFQALIADATGGAPELAVVWLACPVDEGGGFGCATDLSALDLENPDPAALAELGLIGFQPFFEPAYTLPSDLLDGFDDRQRLEGTYILIQILGLPLESIEDPVGEIDFGEVESGYKRLIVSEAPTPNHNPEIVGFTVDGAEVPLEAVVYVEPEQSYVLGIRMPDDAVETYEYLPSDGPAEQRVEEPYASWYSTGGEILEEVTIWPYFEADWTAPAERGASGTWYSVVRDRRGGMAWFGQPWVADVPPAP